MILRIACTAFFLFFFCMTQAQIAPGNHLEYKATDIVYNESFSVGLKLHTNGFGITGNYGVIHGLYKQTIYQFELMDIKHPKESRQQSVYPNESGNPKSYKLGKINNFYNLNASILKKRLLTEKARKSGLAVSFLYGAGVSLGILKPYYLEVLVQDLETRNYRRDNQKYTGDNADVFLDQYDIVGASGFTYGLNEIKIRPGALAKTAFSFDWAQRGESIKALEVGAQLNTYFNRIPILISDQNSIFFLNFYVQFALGKRW